MILNTQVLRVYNGGMGNEQSDNKVAIVIIMRISIAARFKKYKFQTDNLDRPQFMHMPEKPNSMQKFFDLCHIP